MEEKDISIVILGVVAIIAVIGLVLLFKTAFTGEGIYAQVGDSIYGGGRPVWQDNCKELYGDGYIFMQNSRNFDWTCKPGTRTDTWNWRAPGLEPWFNNPQAYTTEGYCCPIGANM